VGQLEQVERVEVAMEPTMAQLHRLELSILEAVVVGVVYKMVESEATVALAALA
jgi:hypothetical protein